VLVADREIIVELYHLGVEQETEERIQQVLVSQEYPLRRALIVAGVVI
jgi:hypothetical protein